MARRGQVGHIEKSGQWYVVRLWQYPPDGGRVHRREKLRPISGAGYLPGGDRRRRATQIVEQAGVNSVEQFNEAHVETTFREQTEWFLNHAGKRKQRPKPRAVSIKEAARLLGISSYTLHWWIRRRRIASVRFGRRVLIPIEAIDQLLREAIIALQNECGEKPYLVRPDFERGAVSEVSASGHHRSRRRGHRSQSQSAGGQLAGIRGVWPAIRLVVRSLRLGGEPGLR